MRQENMVQILSDQTARALWEVQNVIRCIPDQLWDKEYCGAPCWKHVYHMLHSLDRWFINPRAFEEPHFHEEGLNSLDAVSGKRLTREELTRYFLQTGEKIWRYLDDLEDGLLLSKPEGCAYTRFTLMLAQHRHLHTHMGMLMGFIVAETGLWPQVVGLEGEIPSGEFGRYC